MTAQPASRVALGALAGALAAFVLGGCGGGSSGAATYEPTEVERAFRDVGLPLKRLPSVGAEQPAMGETSSCGTRYIALSGDAAISVSLCDREQDAQAVAPADSMHRANVAVEYAGDEAEVHERIGRALDGLQG